MKTAQKVFFLLTLVGKSTHWRVFLQCMSSAVAIFNPYFVKIKICERVAKYFWASINILKLLSQVLTVVGSPRGIKEIIFSWTRCTFSSISTVLNYWKLQISTSVQDSLRSCFQTLMFSPCEWCTRHLLFFPLTCLISFNTHSKKFTSS